MEEGGNLNVDAVVFESVVDTGGGGSGSGSGGGKSNTNSNTKNNLSGIFDSLLKSYDEFDASEQLERMKRNAKQSDRVAKAMQYKAGKAARSLRVKVNTNNGKDNTAGVLTTSSSNNPTLLGRKNASSEKKREKNKVPVAYPDATKPTIYKLTDAERVAMGALDADEIRADAIRRKLVRLFTPVSSEKVERERGLLEAAGYIHSRMRVERAHVRC